MKITWHGHSCFQIESVDGSVILDPYAPGSVPGWKLPELSADLVLCSHTHADHCCPEAIRLTGEKNRMHLRFFDCFHDAEQGALRGTNRITKIESEGFSVVPVGDQGHELTDDLVGALEGADVLMLPVGGYYTIDAAQARKLADQIRPRMILPMHYRAGEFGYPVLAELDEFLALCEPSAVRHLDSPTVTVEPGRGTEVCIPAIP